MCTLTVIFWLSLQFFHGPLTIFFLQTWEENHAFFRVLTKFTFFRWSFDAKFTFFRQFYHRNVFFFVILEGNLHFFQRIFWQNQNFFYHNLQAEVYIFLQSFDKIPHFTASFGNLLSLFFPNYSGLKFSFFSRMLKHNWHFHHASLAEICIFRNRLTKFTFFSMIIWLN